MGNFSAHIDFGVGRSPVTLAAGDFNGDGKQDLAVPNAGANDVSVLLRDCAATPTPTPTPTPPHQYSAQIQQPINAKGTSVFNDKRGVVSVKFTLSDFGTPTCALPPATIALTRTAGGSPGAINESVYTMSADSGSNFRLRDANTATTWRPVPWVLAPTGLISRSIIKSSAVLFSS